MKKIAGKIAMILVLVILANSFTIFTSCKEIAIGAGAIGLLLLIAWLGGAKIGYTPVDNEVRMAIADQNEKTPFMEALDSIPEAEITALTEKINTLPKEELVSLSTTINSLPDAERNYLAKVSNSLSKTEIAALVKEFNSTPEMEIASSIKRINSMPEKKLISILQHIEADYSPDDNNFYLGLRFQY